MTVTDNERPRTKPAKRLAAPLTSHSATSPRTASPLYVPPISERRSGLRPVLTGVAALAVLGGLALAPWDQLPNRTPDLRQALLDVGVPRQYRDLMSEGGPAVEASVEPAPNLEDPALTSLLGKAPPLPPEAMPVAPVASAAPKAQPAPPTQASAPKVYMALVSPAPPKPAAAAAPSYRVQIAATGTDAEAQAAWRDVRGAFPEETADRTLSVRFAEVNGRIVRRALITGFPTAAAAKEFCAKLAAADRGCLLRGKG